MKKLLCVLLSLVLLIGAFSFAFTAFADSSPYVAVLYLCVHGPRLPYFFGHAWINIKNISDETITVGSVSVPPDQMMSVGLHFGGREFNEELSDYRGMKIDALEKYMTQSELETATNEIMNPTWKNFNLFTHNCTHFATSVWRSVTGQSYRTFVFPAVLKSQFPQNEIVKVYIG